MRGALFNPGRRGFIRTTAVAGLGAFGASALGFPFVCRSQQRQSELVAVKGPAAAATRRCVALLGGMSRFVRPGQRVVVKPNIGFDRVPEQAANTNPEVVAEVVRLALEAGAAQVRVFDRSSNDPKRCYRASGIEAAVRSLGSPRAQVFIPDPSRYLKVAIRGGAVLAGWTFYEDAVRADVFINCPVAKHHVMTGLSLGMKNLMGVIGGDRSQMHDGFEDKIADLNLGRPSHLTVLDASRVLRARGPEGGSLLDVARPGIVVAGTNVVAVDAYATGIFGARPTDIAHIARAAQRGLGPLDTANLGLREETL
jgi:uncharacterized protein (DUF362 family)